MLKLKFLNAAETNRDTETLHIQEILKILRRYTRNFAV